MMRVAVLPLVLMLAACAPSFRDAEAPIASIALFDPARYAGDWYEIARYPVSFQKGCVASRATYSLRPDGSLGVVNTCRERNIDGPLRQIEGVAEITGPGRLAVRFEGMPIGSAPYWVLWVDEGYRTAVVGTPSGRAGWILNRDPVIPADRLRAARRVLAFNGYDLSRLEMTGQGGR